MYSNTDFYIRFAEGLENKGSLDFASSGWIHHGSISRDEYICIGWTVERWSPRFTYRGYRYAELSGKSGITDINTLFHERYNNTFYFTEKPSGIPYMIAPGKRLYGVASPDWSTTVVQLPWWMYVYYGNRQVLEEYYPPILGDMASKLSVSFRKLPF